MLKIRDNGEVRFMNRTDYQLMVINHAKETALIVVDKPSFSTAIAILFNGEVRKFVTFAHINLTDAEIEHLKQLAKDNRFELGQRYDLNEALSFN